MLAKTIDAATKSVLALIRAPAATAAELRAALAKVSLASAEGTVERLEVERRAILLDGGAVELAAIEQKITEANREVERTALVIEELNKRLAAAEAKEFVADIESRMAAARAEAEARRQCLIEVDALAAKLAGKILEADQILRRIEGANAFASSHGRADLAVPDVVTVLHAHLGLQPGSIVIPRRVEGYLPAHPDGHRLGRLKELKI